MLRGDREDVADLICFIDSIYMNDDYHLLQYPIANEMHAEMLREL